MFNCGQMTHLFSPVHLKGNLGKLKKKNNNNKNNTFVWKHNFKLTAELQQTRFIEMNLWIYCRFYFNGRLIPIWCSSEYLGQQVGLCTGLFQSYIVSVHHYPGESDNTLNQLTSAIISLQTSKEHKFDLQKRQSHAHSVGLISILGPSFKHCPSCHCHHHCMISIYLQKTQNLNVHGVHSGTTQPKNRAAKGCKTQPVQLDTRMCLCIQT